MKLKIKKYVTGVTAALTAATLSTTLTGCSSDMILLEDNVVEEDDMVQEDNSLEEDDAADEESLEIGSVEPDSYYWLSKNMYLEDIIYDCTINQYGDGYSDYEGDLGEIMDCYKDKDLNGDGEADSIIRKRNEDSLDDEYYYTFEFSGQDGFDSQAISQQAPNEGDLIQFKDVDGDNICEILVNHYVMSTEGGVVSACYCYRWTGDEWAMDTFSETGENGYPDGYLTMITGSDAYVFRDCELVDDGFVFLTDFGEKVDDVFTPCLYSTFLERNGEWEYVNCNQEDVEKYFMQ